MLFHVTYDGAPGNKKPFFPLFNFDIRSTNLDSDFMALAAKGCGRRDFKVLCVNSMPFLLLQTKSMRVSASCYSVWMHSKFLEYKVQCFQRHITRHAFPAVLIHCGRSAIASTITWLPSSPPLHATLRSYVVCVCVRAHVVGLPCLSTAPVLSASPIQSIS